MWGVGSGPTHIPPPTPHALFRYTKHRFGTGSGGRAVSSRLMDDKKAALILAGLALAGAAVKFVLAPAPRRAPGDVTLTADTTTQPTGLGATARAAARLSRPLAPGERIDVDQADVTEIT